MAEYLNNYPNVFLHGFTGWGETDGMYKLMHYWGLGSKDLMQRLKNKGIECYSPAQGPYDSLWDRSCKLWAYLFGGTVDFGKVHSEKYGHARYGKTYEHGVLEDLGKTDAHKKINLYGHSFGGPTVKFFADLCVQGSAEEREGTDPADLSPLFEGGHGNLIHTVTTLAGVNNGTTLATMQQKAFPVLDPILFGGTGLLGNSHFMKFLDFGNQQFGFNAYSEDIKVGKPVNPVKLFKGTKDITEHPMDNSTYEMTIEYCKKINEQQVTDPHIYYFAQRTSNSIALPNGKHLAWPSPNLFCTIPGMFVGQILPKETHGYEIDETWYPNDGYVNVPGQSAPFNAPHEDGHWGDDFKPGIWYNMPVVKHDHVFWNGYSGSRKEYYETWDRIIATNRSLPDAD
ncbi:MAG: hypothetical protein U0K37_06990 [Acutalibacteraceae bacterium]|nr:hypothetical protein [Acutalibacteraceae bacterium]